MAGIARVWTSARLGLQTRARLARMRPRRRQAVAEIVRVLGAAGPEIEAAGGSGGGSGRRVLVVAHVHYPHLWPELAGHVAGIGAPLDLTVTLTPPASELATIIATQFPGARVIPVPNRGRDLAPLLTVLAGTPGLGGYAAVLKVHTKHSPHRRTGDAWRRGMLADLCPGPQGIEAILDVLAAAPARAAVPGASPGAPRAVGMVAPRGSVLGREFLGPNAGKVADLASRAGLRLEPDRLWFPAGAMFWARPQVLADLMALGLSPEDFDAEPTPPDGTLAHALERYLGVVLSARGLGVLEVGELPGGTTMVT